MTKKSSTFAIVVRKKKNKLDMTKRASKFSFLAIMLASVLGFTSCEDEDNINQLGNWIQLRCDFPGVPRSGAVTFTIDNVAYVGTGANTAKTEEKERYRDFYACTAVGEDLVWVGGSKWEQNGRGISSMPEIDVETGEPVETRNGAVAFALNGKGYVGLGYSGYHYLRDFWEFDPKGTPDPAQYPSIYSRMNDTDKANFGKNADGTPTGKWTRIADFPGDSCRYATAFVLTGADGTKAAYVGAGEDYDNNYINTFYKFDGKTWTSADPLGNKRAQAYSFVYELDGIEYGYVVSGVGSDGASEYVERFNPITGKWQEMHSVINKTRYSFDDDYTLRGYGGVAFTLLDKAYIATGGANGTGAATWEYDPAGDFWIQKKSFERNVRANAVAFVLEHEATSYSALQFAVNGKQMVPYLTTGGDKQVSISGSGGKFFASTYLFNPYQAYEELD